MTIRSALAGLAAAAAILLPALASAAPALTTGDVNMRTGPGTAYPVVATLPAGARAEVHGCVEGRTWCDTAWGGMRGWVSAGYLTIAYRGAPVPVVRVPVAVAPPVVVYRPDVYYRTHYVGRPWYPYRAPRGVYVGPNRTCYRGPWVAGCR